MKKSTYSIFLTSFLSTYSVFSAINLSTYSVFNSYFRSSVEEENPENNILYWTKSTKFVQYAIHFGQNLLRILQN